jgi:hypothetical protein
VPAGVADIKSPVGAARERRGIMALNDQEQNLDWVLALLDENSLTSPERVEEFTFRRDLSEVRSLAEGIYESLKSHTLGVPAQAVAESLDASNFLASSSFRGDTPCHLWDCRLRKVRLLARYAALYCDKVVFPLTIETRTNDEYDERYDLCGSLLALLELRPLIEVGYVALVPHWLQLCEKHLRAAVPLYPEIKETAARLAREMSETISVAYFPPDNKGEPPMLQIKGPEDYIEHGSRIQVLQRVPRWIPKTAAVAGARDKRGFRLSRATIRKAGVAESILSEIADGVVLNEYYALRYNARFITDLPGEAEFFRALYRDDGLNVRTAALCARLTHTVPLLAEIPLDTVLKVRHEEPEAFVNYRNALNGIVKDYARASRQIGDSEARQIYGDVLRPQLEKLEAEAKNQRRSLLRKAAVKTLASSAVLAFGIYGGILPRELAELVKAVGGFSVLKDIAEAVGAIERNPAEVRNHNLYFLLRLKQRKPG